MLNPLSGNISGSNAGYGPGERSGTTSTMEPEYGMDPASGVFFGSDFRKHEDLKEMLDANKDNLKLEAMKRIIGMIAKGRDASMLFPDVVKNVVSKNIELKKLVYIYLERYAEEQQDLALLSISTFQRALKEPNQLIRAGALRVLSSIRVTMIAPIVMLAIRDAAADMSPYVRKTAAHAIPKLYSLDMEMKAVLITIIEKLLADRTVLVIGSAVMAFTKVCPERVDLIHRVYRTLCHMMGDVDEWGQVIIVNMLTRYARTQFRDPNLQQSPTNIEPPIDQHVTADRTNNHSTTNNNNNTDNSNNNATAALQLTHHTNAHVSSESSESSDTNSSESESDAESATSEQSASERTQTDDSDSDSDSDDNHVTNSRSHGQQHRDLAANAYDLSMGGTVVTLDPDHRLLLRSTRPLLQSRNAAVVMAVAQLHYHIGPHSELQATVKALVRLLRGYTEVQELVLSNIVSISVALADAFAPHLKSFFVRTSDPTRVKLLKLTILTNVATEKNVMVILRELQTYIGSSDRVFVAAAIQAIGRCACAISSVTDSCLNGLVCLLSNKNEAVVAEAVVVIKRLLQTQAADPSDIILQMARLLDNIRIAQAKAAILWLLGEFCRDKPAAVNVLLRTAKTFTQEDSIVKLQIINLAVKLHLSNKDESLLPLCQYVVSLSRYDQSYDIRDRARLIKYFLDNRGGGILFASAAEVFLEKKPSPVNLLQNNEHISYQLGSLSHYIKSRASGYEPLARFPDQPPPGHMRNVPEPPAHTAHSAQGGQQTNSQQQTVTSGAGNSRHHHRSNPSNQRDSPQSAHYESHGQRRGGADGNDDVDDDSDSWNSDSDDSSDSSSDSDSGSDDSEVIKANDVGFEQDGDKVVFGEIALIDACAPATGGGNSCLTDTILTSTLDDGTNKNSELEIRPTAPVESDKEEKLLDL